MPLPAAVPVKAAGMAAVLTLFGLLSPIMSSGNHGALTTADHNAGTRVTRDLLRNLGPAAVGMWESVNAWKAAGQGDLRYTEASDGLAATFWSFVMTDAQRQVVVDNPHLAWSVSLVRRARSRNRIHRPHAAMPCVLRAATVCARVPNVPGTSTRLKPIAPARAAPTTHPRVPGRIQRTAPCRGTSRRSRSSATTQRRT